MQDVPKFLIARNKKISEHVIRKLHVMIAMIHCFRKVLNFGS